MITFDRKHGALLDSHGAVIAMGIWSGHGDAANDVTREREKGTGPLPAGLYNLGTPRDGGHLGPFVIDLYPCATNQMYGRDLFRVHGDTVNDKNHEASDGCIIAPFSIRQRIAGEADRLLKVV